MSPKDKPLRLSNFMPYRLSVAANSVSSVIATAYLTQFGLSNHEWRLMAVLHEYKTATQQELVGLTQMDKLVVSRAARALSRHGLVIRTPKASDGRALKLTLSPKGLKYYHSIAPAVLALEDRLLKSLSKSEAVALNAMLLKLSSAAAALMEDGALSAPFDATKRKN